MANALQRLLRNVRHSRLVLKWEADRRFADLGCVHDRTSEIRPNDILLFCCFRNEATRLEYFLKYYRGQGVNHFLFIDNGSDDAAHAILAEQSDVSVWRTTASYKAAKQGVHWRNALLRRYGNGHWCVVVDADELLVAPEGDIRSFTASLDRVSIRALFAVMVDMYPSGPICDVRLESGQNPLEVCAWFDGAPLVERTAQKRLILTGGARSRLFFSDNPGRAPTMSKYPLVRWAPSYIYATSHKILPNSLQLRPGQKGPMGTLLHFKFLQSFIDKAREEVHRNQMTSAYKTYVAKSDLDALNLWHPRSVAYKDRTSLEAVGLLRGIAQRS